MRYHRSIILKPILAFLLCGSMNRADESGSEYGGIRLLAPQNGATIYMPHPHFRWERLPDTSLEDVHQIQIARDSDFNTIEVDDSLEVVSRLVSVKPLDPGAYFWRVRKIGDKQWSEVFRFTLGESRIFPVNKGATSENIAAIIKETAKNTPAKVLFEKGDYRINKHIHFRETKDLIIDGGGSTFLLDDEFLSFVSVSASHRETLSRRARIYHRRHHRDVDRKLRIQIPTGRQHGGPVAQNVAGRHRGR